MVQVISLTAGRPITSIRVTLALMLVMVAVLLTAGCAGQQSFGIGKSVGNETLAGTINANAKSNEEIVLALKMYRENLTYPRNKIPDNLLQIIDPSFPKNIVSVDELKQFMILSNQLIPADQAGTKFNLSNKSGNPPGDQVHLIIHLNSTAPLQLIDPIATSVIIRDAESHVVVVWIDVRNLDALVSMEGVKRIELVVPPEHS